MKLYKNVSRFRFRRMFPKGSPLEWRLLWGASLKPGDVIAACTGFNVRVASIAPVKESAAAMFQPWRRPFNGRSHGWFISGFRVTDTEGQWHYTDSCCSPAETVQQIQVYWASMPDSSREFDSRWSKISRMARDGVRICDEYGIVLPEVRAI